MPVGNVQLAKDQSSSFYKYAPDLFNGNIRNMKVGIKKLDNPIGYYTYGYDQLNRIVKMDAWKDAETISEKYKERVTYDPNGNIKSYLRHNQNGVAMDKLTYNYAEDNNKLRQIKDDAPDNVNDQDIDTQRDEDNYVYDCSGNLIEDKSDKVKINWNLYGKVTDVKQNGTANFLTYGYDPMQNRALKVSGTGSAETKTYYFRDAQGNVLATYRLKNDVFSLEEVDIYGSSRLGLLKPNLQLYPSVSTENKDIEGQKRYELSNHLSNVLAVISDRKKGFGNINGNYAYFEALTLTAQDYYPFGMSLPGRTFNTEGYKYSFNGKEEDAEWTKQDYGARMYDKLSGRFWSIDPLTAQYPWYTPYQFAGNTPIQAIDLDGLEPYRLAYGFANNNNPKQNLFHSDNVINMYNATFVTSFNSLGIPRSSKYFWNEWQSTPLGVDALSPSNLKSIKRGESPIVDEQWNNVMKQFGADGTLEEIIQHHHHNKGPNAIPLPASKHTSAQYTQENHAMEQRVGKVSQKPGRFVKGAASVFLNLLPLLINSPNSPVYQFHQAGTITENKAYPTNLEDGPAYYEWRLRTDLAKEPIKEVEYFNSFTKINGEWRGKDPTGQKDYFDKDGNKIKFD